VAIESKLYSLPEASRALGGLSIWTLRAWLRRKDGPLRPVRIGRRIFLSRETVERIAEDGLPSLR